MKRPLTINLVLALCGFALLAVLVWRIGPRAIAANIAALGWGIFALLALGGVLHYVRTWSWYFSVDKQHRRLAFWHLFRVRMVGEAVANLTVAGPVLGETTKAVIVREELALTAGLASVVVDRAMYQFLGLAVIISGAVTALSSLPLSHTSVILLLIAIFVSLALLVLAALLATQRWNLIVPAFAGFSAWTGWRWLERKIERVRDFEETLLDYYHRHPRDFFTVVAINVGAHAIMVAEVWLVLSLLGYPISWTLALVVEMLTKVVNLPSAILPGNLGAYEGGNVLLFRGLSFPASIGISVALTRRIRAIFWAGVGLLCFAFLRAGQAKIEPAATTTK